MICNSLSRVCNIIVIRRQGILWRDNTRYNNRAPNAARLRFVYQVPRAGALWIGLSNVHHNWHSIKRSALTPRSAGKTGISFRTAIGNKLSAYCLCSWRSHPNGRIILYSYTVKAHGTIGNCVLHVMFMNGLLKWRSNTFSVLHRRQSFVTLAIK